MINLGEYLWNLIPETVQPRFIGDLPSVATEGTTCLLVDSNQSTQFFGTYESIYRPIAKFVTRKKQYIEGEEINKTISDALNKFVSQEDGISINQIGTGIYLGRNVEKMHEFQITFEIIKGE